MVLKPQKALMLVNMWPLQPLLTSSHACFTTSCKNLELSFFLFSQRHFSCHWITFVLFFVSFAGPFQLSFLTIHSALCCIFCSAAHCKMSRDPHTYSIFSSLILTSRLVPQNKSLLFAFVLSSHGSFYSKIVSETSSKQNFQEKTKAFKIVSETSFPASCSLVSSCCPMMNQLSECLSFSIANCNCWIRSSKGFQLYNPQKHVSLIWGSLSLEPVPGFTTLASFLLIRVFAFSFRRSLICRIFCYLCYLLYCTKIRAHLFASLFPVDICRVHSSAPSPKNLALLTQTPDSLLCSSNFLPSSVQWQFEQAKKLWRKNKNDFDICARLAKLKFIFNFQKSF